MPPKQNALQKANKNNNANTSEKNLETLPLKKQKLDQSETTQTHDSSNTTDDSHLPMCVYGSDCYRKNPQHFKEYRHPKPDEVVPKVAKSHKKSKTTDKDLPPNFPTAFDLAGDYGSGDPPKTTLELKLMSLSQTIRAKPEWFQKITNPQIRQKWTQEAKSQGAAKGMINYVLKELEEYYLLLIDHPILPAPVDGVYQADGLVDAHLKKNFIDQVAVLENVPVNELDWHPGSNNQVLDLIHPSLFCLVHGVSRVVPKSLPWSKFIGSGVTQAPPKGKKSQNLSTKFQWLPSEFAVDKDGKVSIDSYINNLHPFLHSAFYTSIASIFEKFVPLFNKVLTDALNPLPHRIESTIQYEKEEDSNDDVDDENSFEKRGLIRPTVPKYTLPPPQKLSFDLRGRNLQVIVKIADIILTPDKASYDGGVWHIEGMENERIVATGIYYFASENITESLLEFRRAVREPDFEQNDSYGVSEVYGLEDEQELNQPAGFVVTQADRCIAFPNLYQHKVAPFKLENPKIPGCRKILVFFLVDPLTPIVSTATVPPQQKSWFATELKTKMKGTRLAKLPKEVIEIIVDYLDWPMELQDAKVYREALMKERKYFIKTQTENVFARPFSLCEH